MATKKVKKTTRTHYIMIYNDDYEWNLDGMETTKPQAGAYEYVVEVELPITKSYNTQFLKAK